jgi:transcriptional regulator with XRE-family HTH domain
MIELRARGLSLAEVGRRLGVSRQCVHAALKRADAKRIRCKACARDINSAGALPRDDKAAYCLGCLAARPESTTAERLLAYRLAAGLSVVELALRSGVGAGRISRFEHGKVRPGHKAVTAILHVLGGRLGRLSPSGVVC